MASSWTDEANATAKQYAEALKKQSQYLIDQQNQAKQNTLDALENQRTNSINNLNASKDTINQTALDNAKQANIRRETYTSQLIKGERCTIERPLFISSANFQLINICLHRIKKVRIYLHTLTSQQKIH